MSNIGDPFVLSTYTQPKNTARADSSGLSNVFASHQQVSSRSSDGYVTVAAQGDGVHILDLSTLHPAISYTLGPQSRFSCPPATRTTVSGSSRICTTYAVIESAPDLSPEERGRTVWRWKEDPAGNVTSAEAQKNRISAVAPHKVSAIYAPDELPDFAILVGPGGEITTTDQSLAAKSTHRPEEIEALLKSMVLPRKLSSFVPSRTASAQGTVVILVSQREQTLKVGVHHVDENAAIIPLGECMIPLELAINILDVTCSNTGFISILASSGVCHSFELQSPDGDSLTISKASEPIPIASLSFIPSPSPSSSHNISSQREVSIASVGSSHVLMAGFPAGTNSDLVILLWDLRYSVVLASQTCPIPSTLGRTKKHTAELRLVTGASIPSQAVLVLSPRPATHLVNGDSEALASSVDNSARSSILVVPLSVPSTSTIANAIGRASFTSKWIAAGSSVTNDSSSGLDGPRSKVIRVMRVAMEQKRVEGADNAFFNWIKQEETRSPKTAGGVPKNEAQLGHRFVQGVLETLLKQPKSVTGNIPYSPKVMRYLLGRHAVSSGMVEGGLLPMLRLRNDWGSMVLAIKTVIDIPEADLTSFLHDVSKRQQSQMQSPPEEDLMQVDSATDPSLPSLPDLLALCVTYPNSAAAMRLAIRKNLREAEELVLVLEILLRWVESWCSQDTKFLPQQVSKDEHGILVPVSGVNKEDLPPLEKVLHFVQVLLDSSFLTFLSHAPSHKLIRQIMACLQPELALNDDIEQLRGPLEPFVRAQAKVVSEALHGPPKVDPKVDWRQRKKALHEQAGMTIGLYQVEELVL